MQVLKMARAVSVRSHGAFDITVGSLKGWRFNPEHPEMPTPAQIKAQLANAKWELSQTVFTAPADGTVINLQLRPGQMATALGMLPVMTFVENEYQVLALFNQNELHQVKPGDEAEIALEMCARAGSRARRRAPEFLEQLGEDRKRRAPGGRSGVRARRCQNAILVFAG